NNDFHAKNIRVEEDVTTFDVFVRNNYYDTFQINAFGNHNVLNALSVITLCHYEGIPAEKMKEMVYFTGVKRRFSEKRWNDQVLIDDYAHHPKEVEATIESARKKYPDQEIVAIFQPHTYSRTKTFLNEFSVALKEADVVYLCDIFGSARETQSNLSIDDLQDLLPDSELLHIENMDVLKKHTNSILVFMGAGDIQKYQDAYEKIV